MPRIRRTFRWSKEARDLIRANFAATGRERTRLIAQVAEITGNPRDACFRFAYTLGLKRGRSPRCWSRKEDDTLLDLVRQGYSIRQIGWKLGRSAGSSGRRLRHFGVSTRLHKDSFSKHQLARLLHIRVATVEKWVNDGLLQGRKEDTPNMSRVTILAQDFFEFAKKNRRLLLQGNVREGRLKFIIEFLCAPDPDLPGVRAAKKERAAYAEQTLECDDSGLEADSERRERAAPMAA